MNLDRCFLNVPTSTCFDKFKWNQEGLLNIDWRDQINIDWAAISLSFRLCSLDKTELKENYVLVYALMFSVSGFFYSDIFDIQVADP